MEGKIIITVSNDGTAMVDIIGDLTFDGVLAALEFARRQVGNIRIGRAEESKEK